MKYALVDGIKTEAAKGIKGICQVCKSELIAKCGEIKVNHWAHKNISECDPWWENETEWHRSWKNYFPSEWQEILLPDEKTGEKHIADVRTVHGLVIEFQYSKLSKQERISREEHYKNMIWVVDGTRAKGHYPKFIKGKKYLHKTNKQGCFLIDYPNLCFPLEWLESKVPVIFDYRGTESINDQEDTKSHLYCILPKQENRREVWLIKISREDFIKNTIQGIWFKKQEPQNRKIRLVRRKVFVVRNTHYYDPRKGRFVKRIRL